MEHEIFEHGCHSVFFWTRITRITRILFLHTEARSEMLSFECWMLNCCGLPQCGIDQWWISRLSRDVLNTNNANDTNNYLHADLALYFKRTPLARMHVRVGTLTWGLLNENDTNEIKTDSIRGLVNTNCLRLVLEIESLYSFSPTIGKQAFIVLTYRKSSKSSLLYINQCLKISSKVTSF